MGKLAANTAIESTGCAPWPSIEKILPWLDYYLMDIKHMNNEKHQAFTKQPNTLILENAKRIARKARNLTIRVPVIPTFNDTPAEIEAIAAFAASLPNVRELHLLPYHRLGQDKYKGLGRTYALDGVVPPENEQMERLLQTARRTGLKVQLGG